MSICGATEKNTLKNQGVRVWIRDWLFDLFIYNIGMARNQAVSSSFANMLALNRIQKECHYGPVRVDFSPIQKPNNVSEQIIPCFNHDNDCYTPSFVLPKEKKLVMQNAHLEKGKFQARISHSQNQADEQDLQYKPTDNKYCQLCNECFADYWDHINGKYHKRMINSSKFNKDVVGLCALFEEASLSKDSRKTKKIQKKKDQKRPTKRADLKHGEKCSKQTQNKICQQEQLMVHVQHPNKKQSEAMCKSSMEESLKISLQLGNHSTNLACSKQPCLQC